MTQPDTDTADLADLLARTHLSGGGHPLPEHTATRFGLALLCAVQDHCREIGRAQKVPLALRRVEDKECLYLIAGDPNRERITHTPVSHLVRALLLKEPESPAMGLAAPWQGLPQDLNARTYRTLLARNPWRRDLGVHVSFLALTHHLIRGGTPPETAQRAAAQQLAEEADVNIVAGGQLHAPPETALTNPRLLH